MLFLPELTLLGVGLVFFFLSLGKPSSAKVKNVAITLSALVLLVTLVCLKSKGISFIRRIVSISFRNSSNFSLP